MVSYDYNFAIVSFLLGHFARLELADEQFFLKRKKTCFQADAKKKIPMVLNLIQISSGNKNLFFFYLKVHFRVSAHRYINERDCFNRYQILKSIADMVVSGINMCSC